MAGTGQNTHGSRGTEDKIRCKVPRRELMGLRSRGTKVLGDPGTPDGQSREGGRGRSVLFQLRERTDSKNKKKIFPRVWDTGKDKGARVDGKWSFEEVAEGGKPRDGAYLAETGRDVWERRSSGREAVCVKARLRLELRWSKSWLVLRRSLVEIDRGLSKRIRGISNISRRAEGRLLGVDHGGWREMKGVL